MGNYRGCESVEFVWNGTQSDPDLFYNGYTFNYYDIDDALYEMYCEENEIDGYDGFDEYVCEVAPSYLDDVIFGGYFPDGSTSWHDMYNK